MTQTSTDTAAALYWSDALASYVTIPEDAGTCDHDDVDAGECLNCGTAI